MILRLELGIPQDLLGIARLCRGRLTRVEYVRLRAAGLGTLDALAKASLDVLVVSMTLFVTRNEVNAGASGDGCGPQQGCSRWLGPGEAQSVRLVIGRLGVRVPSPAPRVLYYVG